MPQYTQEELITPSKNEKHYLSVALHLSTRKTFHLLFPLKNNFLFLYLLTLLYLTYPTPSFTPLYVFFYNYCIHKAKAV